MMCSLLGAYIAYLYAAGRPDHDMRARHPVTWDHVVGERDIHSSSNAIFLPGGERPAAPPDPYFPLSSGGSSRNVTDFPCSVHR